MLGATAFVGGASGLEQAPTRCQHGCGALPASATRGKHEKEIRYRDPRERLGDVAPCVQLPVRRRLQGLEIVSNGDVSTIRSQE
jgi:hypothetical protein